MVAPTCEVGTGRVRFPDRTSVERLAPRGRPDGPGAHAASAGVAAHAPHATAAVRLAAITANLVAQHALAVLRHPRRAAGARLGGSIWPRRIRDFAPPHPTAGPGCIRQKPGRNRRERAWRAGLGAFGRHRPAREQRAVPCPCQAGRGPAADTAGKRPGHTVEPGPQAAGSRAGSVPDRASSGLEGVSRFHSVARLVSKRPLQLTTGGGKPLCLACGAGLRHLAAPVQLGLQARCLAVSHVARDIGRAVAEYSRVLSGLLFGTRRKTEEDDQGRTRRRNLPHAVNSPHLHIPSP